MNITERIQAWIETHQDQFFTQERELIQDALEELEARGQQLEAAGDSDTWKEACKRLEAELEQERMKLAAAEQNIESLRNRLAELAVKRGR